MLPISLVIITLNEENNIERCIRSVPFAGEVLVVDSNSTDNTCKIAEDLGAKVIQEGWRGYGAQKAFASEQARYDWILNLDADEALSPELAKEILAKFSALDPECGYCFPRLSYFLGRWIRRGGWYPDWQLRLYHRSHSQWSKDKVHERVIAKKTARFAKNIWHWVFTDIADQVATNNKYSTLQAKDRFDRGERFSWFKFLIKPPVKFLETYFLKLGFLDGRAGFIISVSAAYSVFLRWGKLWELDSRK